MRAVPRVQGAGKSRLQDVPRYLSLLKENIDKQAQMTKSCSVSFTFAGWEGSNKMVESMEAPGKQGMDVLLDHA